MRTPLAFLAAAALALPLSAQAHTDPQTGQDYSGYMRNDGRGSCCDWHDCRPATAPIDGPDGEKIFDRARNEYAYDPKLVVQRPSDDGNWHVCGSGKRLNCIIAPAQSSLPWKGNWSAAVRMILNRTTAAFAGMQTTRM